MAVARLTGSRFAQEVLEAIGDAIGTTRAGIRLSPFHHPARDERPAGD